MSHKPLSKDGSQGKFLITGCRRFRPPGAHHAGTYEREYLGLGNGVRGIEIRQSLRKTFGSETIISMDQRPIMH
jgi:hypothetical protein